MALPATLQRDAPKTHCTACNFPCYLDNMENCKLWHCHAAKYGRYFVICHCDSSKINTKKAQECLALKLQSRSNQVVEVLMQCWIVLWPLIRDSETKVLLTIQGHSDGHKHLSFSRDRWIFVSIILQPALTPYNSHTNTSVIFIQSHIMLKHDQMVPIQQPNGHAREWQ